MQIQVGKLRETLKLLEHVVPRNPSVKSLAFIKLAKGRLLATNLEVTVDLELAEADEPMLLPYHPALEWLKTVPGDERLTLVPADTEVELTWSGGQSHYRTTAIGNYPTVPEVTPQLEAEVDGDALLRAMAQVMPYTAHETSRPVLQSVALFLGDPVSLAASDGFRMAWQKVAGVSIPEIDAVKEVLIPGGQVETLAELLARSPRAPIARGGFAATLVAGRRMRLAVGERRIKAEFGPVAFTAQRMSGTFPNYKQLIPEEPPNKVRVFAPDMQRALKGVRVVAREGSGIIRMAWSGAAMTVSSTSMGVGSTSSIVPVKLMAGGPEKVAAGLDKLRDCFQGKEGMVTMCVTNRASPILFRSSGAPEVLIMPMTVKWDDEKPRPEEQPVKAATEAEQVAAQAQRPGRNMAFDPDLAKPPVEGKKQRKQVVIRHREKKPAAPKGK